MDTLPSDIMSLIFADITTIDDIFAISLVSKHWYKLFPSFCKTIEHKIEIGNSETDWNKLQKILNFTRRHDIHPHIKLKFHRAVSGEMIYKPIQLHIPSNIDTITIHTEDYCLWCITSDYIEITWDTPNPRLIYTGYKGLTLNPYLSIMKAMKGGYVDGGICLNVLEEQVPGNARFAELVIRLYFYDDENYTFSELISLLRKNMSDRFDAVRFAYRDECDYDDYEQFVRVAQTLEYEFRPIIDRLKKVDILSDAIWQPGIGFIVAKIERKTESKTKRS